MKYANISIRLMHIAIINSVLEGITLTQYMSELNILNIKFIIGGNIYENTIYPPQYAIIRVPIAILHLCILTIYLTIFSFTFESSKSE